jgi:hypothetical protein
LARNALRSCAATQPAFVQARANAKATFEIRRQITRFSQIDPL